jgi:3-dehydroquinate dehydratase
MSVRKPLTERERADYLAELKSVDRDVDFFGDRLREAINELVGAEKIIAAAHTSYATPIEIKNRLATARYAAVDKLCAAREREREAFVRLCDLQNAVAPRLEVVQPMEKIRDPRGFDNSAAGDCYSGGALPDYRL